MKNSQVRYGQRRRVYYLGVPIQDPIMYKLGWIPSCPGFGGEDQNTNIACHHVYSYIGQKILRA